MTGDIELCPCCAAHLRVPDELHLMRCEYCASELVRIREGGVRGLALLPPASPIPYAISGQPPLHVNARELLEQRRVAFIRGGMRAQAFWGVLCQIATGCAVAALVLGFTGFRSVLHGKAHELELGALAVLGAMTFLPVLAYTALYFQGRARLEREALSRWM